MWALVKLNSVVSLHVQVSLLLDINCFIIIANLQELKLNTKTQPAWLAQWVERETLKILTALKR